MTDPKSAIVDELVDQLGLSRTVARATFDAIFEAMRALLASGESVSLRDFGTFSPAVRAARAGRNPHTGQRIEIPSSMNVRFRQAPALRDTLNTRSRRRRKGGPRAVRGRGVRSFRGGARGIQEHDDGGGASSRSSDARGTPPPPPPPPPDYPGSDEELAAPESAPRSDEPRPAREIVVRVEDRAAGEPLPVDERSTLSFGVDRPTDENLATGPGRALAEGDVPPGGLETTWVVIARGIEWVALSPEVTVEPPADGDDAWTARFDLFLPETGPSEARRLGAIPREGGDHRVRLLLFARRDDRDAVERQELFREVDVRLRAGDDTVAAPSREPIAIEDDYQRVAPAHTNIRPPHEWTTPPSHLTLSRYDDQTAIANGLLVENDRRVQVTYQKIQWPVAERAVQGPIDRARSALDRFREAHTDALDAIDDAELDRRLSRDFPPPGVEAWSAHGIAVDPAGERAWESIATSRELVDLARAGYDLYNTFFPADGSPLRGWLDDQPPGCRLEVVWRPGDGYWLPDVPWSLMYRTAPKRGEPVDPTEFLGLRFRLGHTAHSPSGVRTLDAPEASRRTNLLYWHLDETGEEALRQRARWGGWDGQSFVPRDPADTDRIDQVLSVLDRPTPAPVAVLYLFCQADAADAAQPRIRFGQDWSGDSKIDPFDISQERMEDEPLVFLNACDSAAGSASYASALVERFAGRGARGYLGTLTRVPIRFADRFATVFFHFFERRYDAAPLAAGEAVWLTRLFFWLHYRNLGGLFYSYVDQYELYRASEDEIQQLRTG